jgi:pseudouridine-5'-phosphate glycosidase
MVLISSFIVGMPYPQNLAMATQVQDIIREQGCVPATIAISKGKINIGLSDKELEYFAKNQDIVKASRRDIPILLAQVI